MAYLITESCTGCGDCAGRCPTRAIRGRPDELHAVDPALCLDCGACGPVCQDEAILDAEGHLAAFLPPAERPLAHVDLDACVGCRLCVWACPFDALRHAPHPAGGHFGVAALVAGACVGCGICALDCPYDAVHVHHPTPEPFERAA